MGTRQKFTMQRSKRQKFFLKEKIFAREPLHCKFFSGFAKQNPKKFTVQRRFALELRAKSRKKFRVITLQQRNKFLK